jgi:SAM-dependent methyltransferase
MSESLQQYSDMWHRKPVLRMIYNDFYDRIAEACVPGLTLEIGAGIGNLKQRLPHVLATDIQFAPWLNCVTDAQHMPFAANVAANIIMVDVLHHIEFPTIFFQEAHRVLRHGGRIVMIEPAITLGSTVFYRLFHHEPVRILVDPLAAGSPNSTRDPYNSNQAIPTLIATKDRDRFNRLFVNLKIIRVDWFSLAVYPLSGGFKRWSLISEKLAHRALKIERAIEPLVGRFIAFRMMLVFEKIA